MAADGYKIGYWGELTVDPNFYSMRNKFFFI